MNCTISGSGLPGVKSVQCRVGPKYKSPPIHPALDFEMPSKVLLVDDEKEFVESLSERLELRNLKPDIAYDGEQAIETVKKEKPDVMVLDLRMPGIDGLEVLRQVKKKHPDIEVVVLTGHGSEEDEKELQA